MFPRSHPPIGARRGAVAGAAAVLVVLTGGSLLAFNPQPEPPGYPLAEILPEYRMIREQPYVPLDDVAKLLGAEGVRHDPARNLYEITPGRGGLLQVDPRGAGRLRPMPETPEPPPPDRTRRARRERTAPASIGIAGRLASQGAIVVNSRPWMPVADLAYAMGLKVEVAADGSVHLVELPAVQRGQKVAPRQEAFIKIAPRQR